MLNCTRLYISLCSKFIAMFRPIRWAFVLIVLFSYKTLFGQFDTVFKVKHELQTRLLDSLALQMIFKEVPDLLPKVIDQLKYFARENKDYRIRIISEISLMRYKHESKTFDAQKESKRFYQLLNIARENQDTTLIIIMSARFGNILRDDYKYAMAISYLLIAYKYLQLVDSRDHRISIDNLAMELAAFYYHIEDYQKSLEILSKSKVASYTNHRGMGCYDLWSQVCLKLKDYECSKKMIQRAYSIYQVNDTTSWWFNGWSGIFKGNLGKIEFYQKNYTAAIALFKEGIRITLKAKMHDNVAAFGLLLAQCYIHTNQASKALNLLPMIKSGVYQKDDPQLYVDYYKLCLILSNSIIQASQNLQYFDSLQHYNLQLQERKNKDLKIKEDLALEISSQELYQVQMQNKIKKQQILRNVILGLIVLSGLFFSRIIYRKQKQLSYQKKLTKEIEEKSVIDLALAKRELDHFKEFLLEKNRKIINLESTLQGIESQQDIEELKYVVILTDEDWKKFKILFERVYPGFFDNLKSNYPLLTQGEIRYFLLLKLDLNNKEMAAILGVSPGAIRTLKSRIHKKLNIGEEVSLMSIIKPDWNSEDQISSLT